MACAAHPRLCAGQVPEQVRGMPGRQPIHSRHEGALVGQVYGQLGGLCSSSCFQTELRVYDFFST